MVKIKMNTSKMDVYERSLKLEEVALNLEKIVNSENFKNKILNLKPYQKLGERSVWKDATNLQIYEHLMRGAERYDNIEDNEWDIYVDDYYTFKNVIGYTLLSSKYIYVNTKFFDVRPNKLIGSNIAHEYGHHLGFSHDFWNTKERQYSLCYQLNRVYEECFNELYINPVSLIKVYKGRKWFKKIYAWVRK